MSAPEDSSMQGRGCQAVERQPTLYNRPGLPSLAYRIGTHGSFLRRMLSRLRVQTVPPGQPSGARPLAGLTTRASDDPAIGLLDACAMLADVLTFYQERIANEAYLRTAAERRSVLELARAIGYELKPGVAAGAYLAFTVDEAPGSPGEVTVPLGTKVQSVPGQGQLPQTFETSAAITARAAWNALRPRLTRPQELAICDAGDWKLYLLGISAGFPAGTPTFDAGSFYPLDPATPLPGGPVQAVEVKQLYLEGTSTNLKAGDLLLLAGKKPDSSIKTLALSIKRVEADMVLQRTRVDLEEEPKPPLFQALTPTFAYFTLQVQPFTGNVIQSRVVGQSWQEQHLVAFAAVQGWSVQNLFQSINVQPPPKLPPADAGAFALRAKLGMFGHNAPNYYSLPESLRANPYKYPWDANTGWDIWHDSLTNLYYAGADVYVERTLSGALDKTWLVLEKSAGQRSVYRIESASDVSLTGFALSAKATGLKLRTVTGEALENDATDKPTDFQVRKTTAYAQSERLELAALPIEQAIEAGGNSLQLDRMVAGFEKGQTLVLSGELVDPRGVAASEALVLSDIVHSGGYTTLHFEERLRHSYQRKTVTLNANVAWATHGETVTEILGSGDGMQAHQRFTLRKPPLTYVPAATTSGAESTLQVRVNDLLWEEAPRFTGLDAASENYLVRLDDDGKAHVLFGNGEAGARLPSGAANVVATYRSGIGVTGMVEAGKLTLLQSRPLGIRGVTNPLAASGAEDPETRDGARSNAPLSVLTLERIVSLRDFEDFARAYAGIGKAQAVALWKDQARPVHITVAAAAGSAASASALTTHLADADLCKRLAEAIAKAADPAQHFVVDTYQPLFFNVKAKVKVQARYVRATVLAAVETALKKAFAFEQRGFGQPVTAAEVVTVIHSVAGVLATDLDQIYRYEEGQPPPAPDEHISPPLLQAAQVRQPGDRAQLLLINPGGIRLEEMTS